MKHTALALVLLVTAACGPAPAPSASQDVSGTASLEVGRRVYNTRCYFCHGYSGDARTVAASFLQPPPLAFIQQSATALDRARVIKAVTEGRDGTAMQPFRALLSPAEIGAVAEFVVQTFVQRRGMNIRYHSAENGWADHERFRAAFAFVSGALQLDTETLNADQAAGKRLFLSACVTCHEAPGGARTRATWDARPLSYPRNGFSPQDTERALSVDAQSSPSPTVDAVSSASPYARHDRAPRLAGLSALEHQGERIYQANCAFCHAADGTGKNWIGRFLEPHARDLIALRDATNLERAIEQGLPGTSMPAWKPVLSKTEIAAVAAYVRRAFMTAQAGTNE